MTAAAPEHLSTHLLPQLQKYASNRPVLSFPCAWALLPGQTDFTLDEEGSRNICELKTKHLSAGC